MKHYKRLISILLVAAMLAAYLVPVSTAEEAAEPVNPAADSYPLDPETLHVRRLGAGTSAEASEEAELALPYSFGDIVRVSILLDAPSTSELYDVADIASNREAISYREQLRRSQTSVQKKIEQATGRALDVQWNMTLLTNMISANVRYGDIVKIGAVKGVKSVTIENCYAAPVTEDETAQPQTANSSAYMVGATETWDNGLGYTGAGTRVAIIDTGLDIDHQSVNADAFDYAIAEVRQTKTVDLFDADDLAAIKASSSVSLNGDGIWQSSKLPYIYNYVDGDTDVTHINDTEGEHGSHVAGISAANRYIKNGSSYEDAASTVYAVGMAPDAQLFIMKVFGKNGGAYDSDYMVAIEDAITLGCDTVNLSLGSSIQGYTYAGVYQDILNRLDDSDINLLVSISAGNSYALDDMLETPLYIEDVDQHTGGSPGTFVNSLCVAAAENIGVTGIPLIYNGGYFFYTETSSTGAAMTSIAGDYDFVYIDAIGDAADYAAVNTEVSLSGKLVIVNRGTTSFYEKGNNAISYNPAAVIVANNQAGTINMSLDDYTGSFPMISITLADANTIKATAQSHTTGAYTYYTGSMTVSGSLVSTLVYSNAEITDFSSWGVAGSLLMKPEITAPGGDIYSIFGTNKLDSGSMAGGTDQYELMSGTSMAAPHIAGLGAVLAQYLKENSVTLQGYSLRALMHSLLMSTAVPMHIGSENGEYYPILQQGAGLVNVAKAVQAKSILMMEEDATLSYADGKVKAELGDKPEKSGSYSYSFTIHNTTDAPLTYALLTDLFTQDRMEYQGEVFMDHSTTALTGWNVRYVYNGEDYDMDRDGDADEDDAQAILDYLVGSVSAAQLDLTKADLDNDGAVSSYDAHLLLAWLEADHSALVVPANGASTVTVTISIPEDMSAFDAAYPCGAYVEGFTYVTCTTLDGNNEPVDVQHSIPILGFYGSWTDPSMFDNTSYVDTLYGTDKTPYSGKTMTNYLTMTQQGNQVRFSGNPYIVEDSFPAGRLAVNSSDVMGSIYYNLIRAAGGTAYAFSKLDSSGKVTQVLAANVLSTLVDGIWFSQPTMSWQNTGTKYFSVNRSAGELGLQEGDRFRVGLYAIPEYNCMQQAQDLTAANAGTLTNAKLNALLLENTLGDGAFVGYDFIVDNTAPVISTAELSGSTLNVAAADEQALAYVAVLSLDGTVKYAEVAPGTDSYADTIDLTDAIAHAHGYVAVFAADYAGNETAVAIRVNDNNQDDKVVYVLTDTLEAGGDYLIVSSNTPGDAWELSYTSSGTVITTNTPAAAAVHIKDGIAETGNQPFIEEVEAAATGIWTASAGIKLANGSNYLRCVTGDLTISNLNTLNSWSYGSSQLTIVSGIGSGALSTTHYLSYSNGFALSETAGSVYLYRKTSITIDTEPAAVTGITLTPDTLDVYKGSATALTAKILPLTASDPAVVWTTSDPSVATVDANGVVTAVDPGTATITATSHADPTVSATCTVTVTSIDKELNCVIYDEDGGVYFSSFNTAGPPTWQKSSNTDQNLPLNAAFTAGLTDLNTTLYAATLEGGLAGTTKLYTVDSSYALTEVGTNYVPATDMAVAANGQLLYSGLVGMVYTYAYFILGGPMTPGDDGSGTEYTGLPYAFLDCRDTIGEAYLCAIATKGRSVSGGTFYVLDENGSIWETTLSSEGILINGFVFTEPTLVVETGIGTSFLNQNLYYDGSWLYWTHSEGTVCELIIINPDTGAVYHAGNFGDGVWPVTGMYVKNKLAPAAAEQPMEEDILPEELSTLRPVVSRDEIMTDEIAARYASELARWTRDSKAANAITGSLNAVRRTTVRDAAATMTGSGLTSDVTISEQDAETNGVYVVTYDPDVLTYVSAESDAAQWAVCHDAANGQITFAYASGQPIPANQALAVLHFAHAEYALSTAASVQTLERGDELGLLDPAETVPLETFAVKGVTLTLNGKINVNCYLSIPDSEIDGLKAVVTTTNMNGDLVTVSDKTLSAADKQENGFYKFSAEMPAKDMLTPVTLVLKRGDAAVSFLTSQGDTVNSYSFTVQQYLDTVIAYPDIFDAVYPGLSDLCRSMSDYGHYAQLFFDYHLTNGAWNYGTYCDTELSTIQSISGYAYALSSTGSGITYNGSSLLLKSGTKIRFYFQITGVNAQSCLAYIDGSQTGVPLVSKSANLYYVEIDDIHAKLLNTSHSVVVSDGTGNSATVTNYSVYSYVQSSLSDTDEKLVNVVRALYLYGEKASAFFQD